MGTAKLAAHKYFDQKDEQLVYEVTLTLALKQDSQLTSFDTELEELLKMASN